MSDLVHMVDFVSCLPSEYLTQEKVLLSFQLGSQQFLFLTWEECDQDWKAPVLLLDSPALTLAFNIIMKDAL